MNDLTDTLQATINGFENVFEAQEEINRQLIKRIIKLQSEIYMLQLRVKALENVR